MVVYLEEFAADALLSVQQAAARTGSPVELLSLRALAHSLFGRRPVDPGGPSEFDILEPLMKCNTMSYDDSVKIEAHLARGTRGLSVLWTLRLVTASPSFF